MFEASIITNILLVLFCILATVAMCNKYDKMRQRAKLLEIKLESKQSLVDEHLWRLHLGCSDWTVPFVPGTNRQEVFWTKGDTTERISVEVAEKRARKINWAWAEEMDSLGV